MQKIILFIFSIFTFLFSQTEKKIEHKSDSLSQEEKKEITKNDSLILKNISFKKNISPLFKERCLRCHTTEEKNKSEYYMNDYDLILKGGKHGVAIKKGNSKESILYQKLFPKPPFGDQMPDSKRIPKFDERELEIIKIWINEGAKNN